MNPIEHLLILRTRTTSEWTAPPDVRLRRALKMLLRAYGLENRHGPIPFPSPDARTPAEIVSDYLLTGEGCLCQTPADVAALETLVAHIGRLALAGQLVLEDHSCREGQ